MKKWLALLLTLLLLSCMLSACDNDSVRDTDKKDKTAAGEDHDALLDPISAIQKANQSAVLQEARNKYTEVHAEDMADGVLNGKNGVAVVSDPNYVVSNGVAAYTYADPKKGYTAIFDGTQWTIVENE